MIEVDISNIWGGISLPDLLAIESGVSAAHAALAEGTGAGAQFRGWRKLPVQEPTEEIGQIQKAAEKIRNESDVCLVVGIGGCSLGSRAVIELLQGPERNMGRGKGDPLIIYAGDSLSTRQWNDLMRLLEDRDFSVIVISKTGATLESALAFRGLRWQLQLKYGTDEANRRIYAVTGPEQGGLRQMVQENGWESFDFPADVEEGFCVLSAAGLLPLAVAGIDIMALLRGAARGAEEYDLRSFENPVWLYAAVRNVLYRSGRTMELFAGWEPGFRYFGRWWQQLFACAEGKDGKGIFPAPVEYPADLHSLGQMIQQGERYFFETMVRFAPPEQVYTIVPDWKDLDGLNYLEGKNLDFVEEQAYQAAVAAHVDGDLSVITMECGELREETVGDLLYFLELCCAISACTLGVNPYERSGMESYESNSAVLMGKSAPSAE